VLDNQLRAITTHLQFARVKTISFRRIPFWIFLLLGLESRGPVWDSIAI